MKIIKYFMRLVEHGRVLSTGGFELPDGEDAYAAAHNHLETQGRGLDPLSGQWLEISRIPPQREYLDPAKLAPKPEKRGALRESNAPEQGNHPQDSRTAPPRAANLPTPAGYMPAPGKPLED